MTTEASKFFVPVLLVVALLSPLVLAQQNCPSSEWIENGDFCYLLVKGANGRTFDQARTDCQSRGSGSDLLWISSEGELSWFQDYSARQWNIKRDWSQCSDCVKNIEAAWIGAYRSDTGIFKWTIDDKAVEVKLNWWLSQPKEWPADYVLAYDSGSQMRYRTETKGADRKFWHFCKVQHREPTTSTPMSTTTLPPYLGPCPARDWTEQGDSCYLLVRGDTGRGVDEAARDCSSRHPQAGLLWIESAEEAAWVTDNSKAAWNLKRDWAQCRDCQSDSAAWTSLRRSGGVWGWGDKTGIDQSSINWFVGHPRDPPNDFGSLYDSGTSQQLRVRSENATSKMWHICKFRFRANTATTVLTTSTEPSTVTSVSTSAPTTTAYDGACPSSEWIENGDFCYLLVKGANGRTFDQARTDCQSRGSGSDLLWISSEGELSWFQDYSARQWSIKRDWSQCSDCVKNIEAAWIGAYRDVALDQFKWLQNGLALGVTLDWWLGHPRGTPADFVIADDTGSQMRYRSETKDADRKFWHFCKVQHREPTTSTPMSTTTLPPYLGPCPARDWTEQGDSCYLLVRGDTGRGVDEAARDCSSRHPQAGLLWIESAEEAAWVTDNSKAAWNLKRDWAQCRDCQSDSAAWTSLRRSGGVWGWGDKTGIDQSSINWFVGHPRDPPNDFGSLYDSGTSQRLRVRSENATSKMWHICKFRFRANTATTNTPTTPTPHMGVCPGPEWQEFSAWCYLLVKGANGRTFEQAKADCRSRGKDVDLLWIEADVEHEWWVDHSERSWNIKRDWAQCTDCYGAAGAWIGLSRDSSGFFRWIRNNQVLDRNLNWFLGGIKDPPADYVYLFDTDTQLRFRTELGSVRLWHFCKTNHSEYTGPTNSPRPSSSTPQSTTTSVTTTTRATTTKYVGNCPSSEWLEFEHSCYLLVKGTNGRAYSEARADCQSRNADLLWVRSDREMAWIRDYAGRTWGIKRDWRQCTNCDNIEAAWFGLYRDLQDRKIKWAHDQTVVDIELSWWITDPLPSPNDYGVLFDSGSQLRLRLLQLDRVLWHFCKIDYEESTATTPRPTTGTPRPTRYPPGPCINTDWTAYGDSCYTLVKNSYGINWSGALTACKALDYRAELLWLSSRDELRWLLDFNARNWRLSADYRQCLNCTSLEGAWVGLFRDSSGNFRWKNDLTNNTIDLSTSWFFGHPKGPPNNFVMIYDRLSTLYLRTEVHDDRYWYFCKYNYRYSTPPLTQPTVSTSSGPTSGTVAPIGPCPEVGEPWIEYNGNCYSVRKPRQGLTWSEARDACRSVSETSDLAWLESESELAWLIDYSVRSWNIKADWRSCANCNNVEGAWIGLFRDEEHDGLLKWAFNGRTISIAPNWWPEHPKQSPNNYGLLFDTSTSLRMRTEVGSGRYWYFCKAVGKYPATQPTQQATFWTSGAVHILWVIPLLLVLAGLAFYMIRAHRRRSAPSNLESASQPVMMRENPAFNSYSALGNVQSNQPNGKTASLDGDSVAVTLKDRLEDDDVA